nr:OB-fold-containig protein [uncultured Carboxylicivirga sp.]
MKELFEAAFSGVNLIPTVFLLLILVYWIFVIIGAMDMDVINIDIETDVDLDVDVDVDADVDSDVDADSHDIGSVAFLNSILTFFNLGKIPFMVWLSFLIIPMWVISILFNHYLHNSSFLISLVALIPNLVASLLVSKVLTTPIAAIFTKIKKNDDDSFKYTGKMCTVLMQASHNRFGQAEIKRDGNTYRVNILTKDESIVLDKGQTALIIEFIPEKKCYLVEPYKI